MVKVIKNIPWLFFLIATLAIDVDTPFRDKVAEWQYIEPQEKFVPEDGFLHCPPAVPIPYEINVGDEILDVWLTSGRGGFVVLLLTIGPGNMIGNLFLGPFTMGFLVQPEESYSTYTGCVTFRLRLPYGVPLPPVAAGHVVTMQFATVRANGTPTEISYAIQTTVEP